MKRDEIAEELDVADVAVVNRWFEF